jgi:hypothetical protein
VTGKVARFIPFISQHLRAANIQANENAGTKLDTLEAMLSILSNKPGSWQLRARAERLPRPCEHLRAHVAPIDHFLKDEEDSFAAAAAAASTNTCR